jgi:ATP-binding protein involved in chromosome partitioning
MPPTEEQVLSALRTVTYPGFSRDVVSLGVVRDLRVVEDRVRLRVVLGTENPELAARIEAEIRQALDRVEGLAGIEIDSGVERAGSPALKMVGAPPSPARAGAADRGLLPEVRHVVAVASGKGGVGKSTIAVNLAVALGRLGLSVGLLDADVYGPSIPLMMGVVGEKPRIDAQAGRLVPFDRFGVRFMSLGFFVDPESAVIWRGPMVMKAIEQLLRDVDWADQYVLIVDMPPGTGDAQLTLAQRIKLAGALIVTTPQDVALADAIKGVAMFRKVDVDVLGIVENMSYFECPQCATRSEIFGHGGGRREAERLGVPFLGEIPLEPRLRRSGDSGIPIVESEPDSAPSRAFAALAAAVRQSLDSRAEDRQATDPGIFERFRRVWNGPEEEAGS